MKNTKAGRIARRTAYTLTAAACLTGGLILGATSAGPGAVEVAHSEPSLASDGGGESPVQLEDAGSSETLTQAEEDAIAEGTADEAASVGDDPTEVSGDDMPEIEVLDPAEQEDLPEVVVIEGDVEGEDYIPIEGDDEEYVDEDSRVLEPDAVNVILWYGEDGSLEAVNLVGPEGEDVPVGSISEQFGDDDNTDAEE